MRTPKIKLQPKVNPDEEIISLSIVPERYEDDESIFEPGNEKALDKYVDNIKYMIRKSYEYVELMKNLKEHDSMDYCGVHHNIGIDNGYSIEIHHHPFTAEDIIYTVLKKRHIENQSLKMSDIAEEVMMLHYLGIIGLYPLCTLCHGYVHSEDNDLFIPLTSTKGNSDEFYELYKVYMSTGLQTKYENIRELSKGLSIIEDNLTIGLQKKYLYINNPMSDSIEDDILSMSKLYEFINTMA